MSESVHHSIFLSYSSRDRLFVQGCATWMRACGVTVFLDVVDLQYGLPWKEALFEAISKCERVLVFWSKAAAESEWVDREWRIALESGKKIVPVGLDSTPMPPELSAFHGIPELLHVLQLGSVSLGVSQHHRNGTPMAKPGRRTPSDSEIQAFNAEQAGRAKAHAANAARMFSMLFGK